jgi:hypothetical protein
VNISVAEAGNLPFAIRLPNLESAHHGCHIRSCHIRGGVRLAGFDAETVRSCDWNAAQGHPLWPRSIIAADLMESWMGSQHMQAVRPVATQKGAGFYHASKQCCLGAEVAKSAKFTPCQGKLVMVS